MLDDFTCLSEGSGEDIVLFEGWLDILLQRGPQDGRQHQCR